jgi:hypothetical protein
MKLIASEDLREKTIEEAESFVWRFVKKHKANAIVWDNDGRGRIAGGYLEMSCQPGIELFAFEGSSREVDDKETFYNIRDEAHWCMRDDFVNGTIALAGIDQTEKDKLIEELSSCKEETEKDDGPKAKYLKVESKKKEKRRLGHSPDHRDNVMMASYANKFFDIKYIEQFSVYSKRIKECDYQFNPMTC